MGPWKQLQSMFQPARYMSTLIYFGAMGGTLYAALSVPGALSRSNCTRFLELLTTCFCRDPPNSYTTQASR